MTESEQEVEIATNSPLSDSASTKDSPAKNSRKKKANHGMSGKLKS